MNWYKKAQALEVIDQRDVEDTSYLDYGHDVFKNRNIEERIKNPNYMWVLDNGNIDKEAETQKISGHHDVTKWNHIDWDKVFSGRYDHANKSITVLPPYSATSRFRDIHRSVRFLLRKAFPDAQQLYVYASNSEIKKIADQVENPMSWYKIAQLNGGKVKYGPDGSFFILGKNTKRGEGPWRISYFDEDGRGWTHKDFKTYEDAEAVFNYTWGTEDPPKKEEYELV